MIPRETLAEGETLHTRECMGLPALDVLIRLYRRKVPWLGVLSRFQWDHVAPGRWVIQLVWARPARMRILGPQFWEDQSPPAYTTIDPYDRAPWADVARLAWLYLTSRRHHDRT